MEGKTKKIVALTKDGKEFLIGDLSKDFHTHCGVISKNDFSKRKCTTNTGKEFFLFTPCFVDLFKSMKRAAQVILPKDSAAIVAETMVGKKSVVVDAGVGSGFLAAFLANICKKVISYEVRKEFVKIAKKNRDLLGLMNWEIKHKDVKNGIDEKNVDLVVFDLPEPWNCLDTASAALKRGAFFVCYLPNLTQVKRLVEELGKRDDFVYIKTIEVFKREWLVKEKLLRPEHHALTHTAFLVFSRRV